MSQSFTRTWYVDRDPDEIEVVVEYTATPYIPEQTYGLPENCHPAEGGEIEIDSVKIAGTDIAIDPPLTEAEESRLIDHLFESMDDSDFNPDDEGY